MPRAEDWYPRSKVESSLLPFYSILALGELDEAQPLWEGKSALLCLQVQMLISSRNTSDQIRSDQSLSHVRLFATPWIKACQASLSITNSRSSLRLTSIESVMPSSHLILCRPLLVLPPIPPSISLFQWVNSSHEVAKVLHYDTLVKVKVKSLQECSTLCDPT